MKARLTLLALMTLAWATLLGPSAASAQAINLFAVLRGPNEIPTADPNGSGTAMVSFRGTNLTTICVTLFVDAIDTPRVNPNGAHIHRGGGSVNGPIVVGLNAPAAGSPGFSNRCVAISAELSAQIRGNPPAFYVNVHTQAFPGGAI